MPNNTTEYNKSQLPNFSWDMIIIDRFGLLIIEICPVIPAQSVYSAYAIELNHLELVGSAMGDGQYSLIGKLRLAIINYGWDK
jgi:hypothetical protein